MQTLNKLKNSNLINCSDNDCEQELVGFVREAIASKDLETATQIQEILKEVCGSGHADRRKVGAGLSQSEQSAFKALLAIDSKPVASTDSSISIQTQALLAPKEFHQ